MERDLSGAWAGQYVYPDTAEAVFFSARLFENAGRFIGLIEEDDAFEGRLTASVDGRRSGQNIRFTKFYELGSTDFDIVTYEGVLSADSSEIEGRWTVPNNWSGRFLMVRSSEQATEIGRVRTERV